MDKKQQKRFEVLIECTEQADKKAFDTNMYAHRCGSPACIIGNYAANQKVQKTFKLEKVSDVVGGEHWTLCLKDGRFVDYYDQEVQDHFGIDRVEADEIFGTTGCDEATTPKQAVKYLKRFYKLRLKETTA